MGVVMNEREKQYAAMDRVPWDSIHFVAEYDDREEYPWALLVRKTGRLVSRFRRRFAAQSQAKRLDKIITDILE